MEVRPFGSWPSPLSPDELAHSTRLRDVAWDADGRTLVWLEGRGPQGVLVCQEPGAASRDLNAALSVRAQVGYGGGDFAVAHGHAYFAEHGGRLYRQPLARGPAQPITPQFGHAASPAPSPTGRHLAYVHSYEDRDALAIVDGTGCFWPQILAAGADFYMQPAWHPRGDRLAWVEWDHPHMPWDGTRLVLGQLARSRHGLPSLRATEVLAGGADTAIAQPCFSPDGRYLVYVSDERGYSNLWCRDLASGATRCLCEDASDVATPAWVQGLRTFSWAADSRTLYFVRSENAQRLAYALDFASGAVAPVEGLAAYTHIEQLAAAPRGKGLACIAAASATPARIVAGTASQVAVRARSASESLAPADLSTPAPVSWASEDATQVHGLYYPPANRRFAGRGRPPLIVLIHGGPTGQIETGFEPTQQFFATRGFAVLDVDYRGSTGRGREYMRALRSRWGVLDVEDAVGGAEHLVARGLADPERLVIMGGSAGGYTVLRALSTRPGFFRAGICLYGVANLFALAADTHKFESRYLDSMIGPLPEAAAVYRERSPIYAADQLRDPLALFQGTDDQVVPPAQAEEIAASLRRRNIPHVYHLYEGEGHGWRKPETVRAFYQACEAFLRQHVLFA